MHTKRSFSIRRLDIPCSPRRPCYLTPDAYACFYMQAISSLQMQKGFKCLVGAAPDLKLDVPDAPAQIATFLARAVIDDVMPSSFVEDLSAGEHKPCCSGMLCHQMPGKYHPANSVCASDNLVSQGISGAALFSVLSGFESIAGNLEKASDIAQHCSELLRQRKASRWPVSRC